MSDQVFPERVSEDSDGLSEQERATSTSSQGANVAVTSPGVGQSTPLHGLKLTGSLFYLFSATCILIGLTKILVPIFDADGRLTEKLWSIGAINVYELGLLAVLMLVMWRKVYDDAVSLATLVAAFLVASAVTLNVVAAQLPWVVIGLGAGGMLLCVGKLAIIRRFVVGRFKLMPLLVIGILMAANLALPGIMGYAQSNDGTNGQLHELWYMGWCWTVVGLLVLCVAAMMNELELFFPTFTTPVIRSSNFRMVFLGIIVVASIGQQWAMQWAFFLKGGLPDLIMAWPLLVIAVVAWSGVTQRLADWFYVLALLLPGITVVLIDYLLDLTVPITSVWSMIAQPVVAIAISGILVLILARRYPWWLLTSLAGCYFLAAVYVWPNRISEFGLTPKQWVWASFVISAVLAMGLRHYLTRLLVSVTGGWVILTLPVIGMWFEHTTDNAWVFLFLMPTVLCSLTLCCYRRTVPLRLTVALLLLGVLCVMILIEGVDTDMLATNWSLVALAWSVVLAWSHRRWLLVLPGLVPLFSVMYWMTRSEPGWQMVAASFLLLLVGMLVSWQRSHSQNA